MIANIQKNLAAVRERIGELRQSKTSTEAEISDLETKFIGGKTDHTQIQAKRTILMSITDSLRSLISRETELSGDLDAALDRNDRAERVKAMSEAGKRAARAVSEYDALLEQASQQVQAIGHQLALTRTAIGIARKEFFNHSRQGDVSMSELGLSADELRIVQETKIRHHEIDLRMEVGAIEAAMLARLEKGSRPMAATA